MKAKLLKRRAFAAALAATLFGGASVGFAEEVVEVSAATQTKERAVQSGRVFRSSTIRYDDLNLTRPAGVRALYQRIDVAAKKVCAPEPDARDFVMRSDWQQCYDSALDNGVASANLPAVTRYHLVKTGRIGDDEQVARAH